MFDVSILDLKTVYMYASD